MLHIENPDRDLYRRAEGAYPFVSTLAKPKLHCESNFTRVPHELHCESIESLSCHPERRAKPAVEPEGRCIASGYKEHYQRLALAKGELYRSPRSCSVTPRTAPRFDSASAPLRMTRVGAIRLINLLNNEVASLMNYGYVLSEPESTKGRDIGMCFIESSSLCLHFGKAKTSLRTACSI